MSSLRSSRAARLRSPPATQLTALPPRASSLLMLLLVGCSSAGDASVLSASTSDGGESSSGFMASASSPVSGGGSGDPGDPGEDGYAEETGAASGEGASSEGGEGPSPDQPPLEPSPEDVVGAKMIGGDTCDLINPVDLTLRTFDATATVSPTQARDAALSDWVSLTGIRIRPWEFFNYYNFAYPAPEPGAVTITPQLTAVAGDLPSPEFVLQVGVTTHALPPEKRPPLRLTLALDNSNSMVGKAHDMLRATGKAIAGSLRAGDTLSIVTWNSKSPTILELHAVSGPDDTTVLEKFDQLQLGGSAELYSGLMAAYKLANLAYEPSAWNRVLLVSDGGASASDTDLAVIVEQAEKQPGIYLSGVGVGDAGIYRSDMMDAAAHAGRGASLFIGNESEASKRFGEQFERTLGAAVRQVEVHLDLPPGFEVVRDLETDSLNDPGITADSVHLGPNSSLVLHRRLRSCDPKITSDSEAELKVQVRFIDEATGELKQSETAVKLAALLADKPSALHKGVAVLAYAQALQLWQARPADLMTVLAQALERVKAAQELLPNDPELAEINSVLTVLSAG